MWRGIWASLWCLILSLYVILGVKITPFHGDEAMLIDASRDFETLFVEHRPQALITAPPYTVDTPAHLRILNGSVAIYSMGLSRYLQGLTLADLGLWHWESSYDRNLAEGNRPNDQILGVVRNPLNLTDHLGNCVYNTSGFSC